MKVASTRNDALLLGIDGGGTRCRARLTDLGGTTLGEGVAGPANIRLGLEESFSAVRDATGQCLRQAGRTWSDSKIIACLALAGATEPAHLAKARAYPHPFYRAAFTNDARAACVGAHAGSDGAVIIVGTGSVAWAIRGSQDFRVGGWGLPISDAGSAAWIGFEAVRRVLLAHDGLMAWTDMLGTLFERFDRDPHQIVRWVSTAKPRDFGSLAPIIAEHATRGDTQARDLIGQAARHVDCMAARLIALEATPISLMGGFAGKLEPMLSDCTRRSLVAPLGDALSGALRLARAEAQGLATDL